MEFPIDVNKFEVPNGVFESMLARQIHDICLSYGIHLPAELVKYVTEKDLEAGYTWQAEMMKISVYMPLDVLKKWVEEIMPRGLCRAEMRAILKSRETRNEAFNDTNS